MSSLNESMKGAVDTCNVLSLLRKYSHIKELEFADGSEPLTVEEIGDGWVNSVFRVFQQPSDYSSKRSAIVKFGEPFFKRLGPDHPLGIGRISREYDALCKYYEICPGSVPKPYFYDHDTKIVCMEELRDYRTLQQHLNHGELEREIGYNIAVSLAKVHYNTHSKTVDSESITQLNDKFPYSDFVSVMEQISFVLPSTEEVVTIKCSKAKQHLLRLLFEDQKALTTIREMKQIFVENRECLIHGDMHTGSILVKGEDVKAFDLEFAHMGPSAYDVGMLIAHFLISYFYHVTPPEGIQTRSQFPSTIVEACKLIVNTYLDHTAGIASSNANYTRNFISEVAGFAGCELMRGLLRGEYLDISLTNGPAVLQNAFAAGIRLLHSRESVYSVDSLMRCAILALDEDGPALESVITKIH